MDSSTVRKLVRHTALILTSALQLIHAYLLIEYMWMPPKKPSQKMTTMTTLMGFGFSIFGGFKIAKHSGNIKLGRFIVRGLGIELLLWTIVLWSAALVGVNTWADLDRLMTSLQLCICDIIMYMSMFGSVELLDSKECGDQPAANEKTEKAEV